MSIPVEFAEASIAERSQESSMLWESFVRSSEPMASLITNNPSLRPTYGRNTMKNARDPEITEEPHGFTEDPYWETTVARKHHYWKDKPIPKPTKDIDQLRHDFVEWGYCLIEDGLSEAQCQALAKRVKEQGAAEKEAGTLELTPEGYRMWALINKGREFLGVIEHDPEYIQAGLVIEWLMDSFLGPGWIAHSFLSLCAEPNRLAMPLHIDQASLLPWVTPGAPVLVNTMILVEDVDDQNGGTLIVPGSHKLFTEAGSNGNIGALGDCIRPISLEAKAGTIMLWDGRVLHGTGVNKSNRERHVVVMACTKPWMRSQENYVLVAAQDVIGNASPKLRHRLGLQAASLGATVEGFGVGARGMPGEVWGDFTLFRKAYDNGEYIRVRELSPASSREDLEQSYTIKQAWQALDDSRK